jgi:hypothetical protein
MRKIILFLVCYLSVVNMNAQKVYAWMDAGLKVGYGLTGMMNSNLFDDKNYEHHLTTGSAFGAKLGLFIGLYDGITVDFMFSDNNQTFDFNVGTNNYPHEIKWKNYDLAVLYRMQKDGLYLEIGPQFSFVNKVTQENPLDVETDVKKYYSTNYISGVFGIGGYILNYEQFTTMLGIRLGYGFTDMINDEGKKVTPNPYPTPKQEKIYNSKSTNAAFVQLSLEFNFALGYYGRSACSKRSSLFSF